MLALGTFIKMPKCYRLNTLMWLMYVDSLDVNTIKPNNRVLRSNDKYIFKVDRKKSTKNRRSSCYIGTLSWNELPASVQTINDVIRFKQLVGMRYRT